MGLRSSIPAQHSTRGSAPLGDRARLCAAVGCLTAALVLQGCGAKPAGPPDRGPPEVGVVTLSRQSVALTTELPGRTSASLIADVRPQVNGLVKARLFTEGSNVRAGQVLYSIDADSYRATLAQAQALLANGRAALTTAELRAGRYADLVKIDAVSKQEADDAAAALGQARAVVKQQSASVEAARIDLARTSITAPISGRVGRSTFTQGALVTAGQPGALTTVQRLDPIYVDVTQSVSELLQLRRDLSTGRLDRTAAEVRLKLADGSDYPFAGRVQFTDVTVDQASGAVTLRALFPNPQATLLPGMYVRARVDKGVAPGVLLAPQQAVTRDERGQPTAMVVNAQGRAEPRVLKTESVLGDKWLVREGLNPGDRLIVEGLLNVRPGAPVRAVPAGSRPASPAQPTRLAKSR